MSESRRILLADDSANDVELTLAALRENRLMNEVDVVRDGVEAWEYLSRTGAYRERAGSDPAVVLLDIKMPRLTGLEVLRKMRASEELKGVPAVILTSSGEERDIAEGYQLGANAYVVKPVAFESFMEAVRALGLFWAIVNVPPPTRPRGSASA